MSKLSNSDVSQLDQNVDEYRGQVIDAAYDYYQKVSAFIVSNAIRGTTGDMVMSYYDQVHLYLINRIMNVASELSEASSQAKDIFFAYESTRDGLVDRQYVEEKRVEVDRVQTDFESHETRLKQVESEILGIAGVSPTNTSAVTSQFGETNRVMNEIKEQLQQADDDLYNQLSGIEQRVNDLKSAITEIDSSYRTDQGFSVTKIDHIRQEEWYTEESADVFTEKYVESPYEVGQDTYQSYVTEIGYVTDIGTSVSGLTANEAGYEYEIDGTTMNASADYTGLEARTEFESTYLNSSGKAEVGYATVAVEASETGFNAEGNVGVAQAQSSLVAGSESFNVKADAEAGFLTAEGDARANTGGVGLSGMASLGHVEAKGGFTVFDIGVELGVSAGGQVGGGFELSWDKVEIDLRAVVGGTLTIDLPFE